MPFVAAPNCVSLQLNMLLDNQPIQNTFHYRLAAPATPSDLTNIIDVAFTYYGTNHGAFSTFWALVKGYARALDSASAPSVELNPVPGITGSDASELQPNNVTFALTRYSGLAGRANRGRVYWPGITRDQMVGANTISVTVANGFIAFLNAYEAAQLAGAAAAQEVILHRALGTHVDVAGYRYADVNIDSQRRRLPGHNIHH